MYSPHTSVYLNIHGSKQHGYGAMPRAEERLMSHLSPASASSLKALPTKPLSGTSALWVRLIWQQIRPFQKFPPCRTNVFRAAGWEQPQLSASSSHRAQQKQSVTSHAPPQKNWEAARRSQVKPDLRTVIVSRKA